MRAVALLVSLSLLGCFPHDAHRRTIAQLVEGGTLGLGVGMEYFANSQADCDQMMQTGGGKCSGVGQTLGSVGVALILGGLVGFIVTVSGAEDDSANDGSGGGSGSGSAR